MTQGERDPGRGAVSRRKKVGERRPSRMARDWDSDGEMAKKLWVKGKAYQLLEQRQLMSSEETFSGRSEEQIYQTYRHICSGSFPLNTYTVSLFSAPALWSSSSFLRVPMALFGPPSPWHSSYSCLFKNTSFQGEQWTILVLLPRSHKISLFFLTIFMHTPWLLSCALLLIDSIWSSLQICF